MNLYRYRSAICINTVSLAFIYGDIKRWSEAKFPFTMMVRSSAKFPDVALLKIRVHKRCSKAILYCQRNVHLISRLVLALNPILRQVMFLWYIEASQFGHITIGQICATPDRLKLQIFVVPLEFRSHQKYFWRKRGITASKHVFLPASAR